MFAIYLPNDLRKMNPQFSILGWTITNPFPPISRRRCHCVGLFKFFLPILWTGDVQYIVVPDAPRCKHDAHGDVVDIRRCDEDT